tara:strand:- start:12216 stop:12554 length:339 start_codon:yes stop_codon:yes gene_type:complete
MNELQVKSLLARHIVNITPVPYEARSFIKKFAEVARERMKLSPEEKVAMFQRHIKDNDIVRRQNQLTAVLYTGDYASVNCEPSSIINAMLLSSLGMAMSHKRTTQMQELIGS